MGATLVSGTSTGAAQNDDGTSVTSIMPDTVQEALFTCCEELELLSRDSSNDEGQDSAVASGAMLDVQTENPAYLIAQGIRGSALKRIPFPSPDWDNPLPEHTPGYYQKSFPFILLSGDADPWQDRPRDIKKPTLKWEENYIEWLGKQAEAHKWQQIQQCL